VPFFAKLFLKSYHRRPQVVLLIYLCTRCCDTKNSKKRKSRPIRCCLSFFALVTCATLAGGFWGNHVLHSGVVEFEKATENINSIVMRAQEMTRRYNDILQKRVEQVTIFIFRAVARGQSFSSNNSAL
jgi:hypothetical protein